jgi:hypothetical protein
MFSFMAGRYILLGAEILAQGGLTVLVDVPESSRCYLKATRALEVQRG